MYNDTTKSKHASSTEITLSVAQEHEKKNSGYGTSLTKDYALSLVHNYNVKQGMKAYLGCSSILNCLAPTRGIT